MENDSIDYMYECFHIGTKQIANVFEMTIGIMVLGISDPLRKKICADCDLLMIANL